EDLSCLQVDGAAVPLNNGKTVYFRIAPGALQVIVPEPEKLCYEQEKALLLQWYRIFHWPELFISRRGGSGPGHPSSRATAAESEAGHEAARRQNGDRGRWVYRQR